MTEEQKNKKYKITGRDENNKCVTIYADTILGLDISMIVKGSIFKISSEISKKTGLPKLKKLRDIEKQK